MRLRCRRLRLVGLVRLGLVIRLLPWLRHCLGRLGRLRCLGIRLGRVGALPRLGRWHLLCLRGLLCVRCLLRHAGVRLLRRRPVRRLREAVTAGLGGGVRLSRRRGLLSLDTGLGEAVSGRRSGRRSGRLVGRDRRGGRLVP
ncbi:hypothetical protein SMCF_4968, partial [Streptomyces coelicoflavus ZG0656]